MKFLFLVAFLFSSLVFAETNLFLFGGGARPHEALKDFIRSSGGENSYIVIIPWASEDNEGAKNIERDLRKYTDAELVIAAQDGAGVSEHLSKATGIFFTGGDQNQLMKIMLGLNLKSTFKRMYGEGVAFAGTSAGTAIMSEKMITGEGNFDVLDGKEVVLAEGLGLLPDGVIVDQHFTWRSRFNRLAGVVLSNQYLGIGIDEDNVLYIHNNQSAAVYGPTEVLFFQSLSAKKMIVDVYEKEETFNLGQYPAFNGFLNLVFNGKRLDDFSAPTLSPIVL